MFKSFLSKYRWAILVSFVLIATSVSLFVFADPPEPTTELRFLVDSVTTDGAPLGQITFETVFVLYEKNTNDNTWMRRPGNIVWQTTGHIHVGPLSFDAQYKLVQVASHYLHTIPDGYWIIHVDEIGEINVVAHSNPAFRWDGTRWRTANAEATYRNITVTHVWAQCVLDAGISTEEVHIWLSRESIPMNTRYAFAVLNADNNWTHTFYGLPIRDPRFPGRTRFGIRSVYHNFGVEYSGVDNPFTGIVSGSNHITLTSQRVMRGMSFFVVDNEMNRIENALFAMERFYNGEWIRTGETFASNASGNVRPYVCFESLRLGRPYRLVVIDVPDGFVLPIGAINVVPYNQIPIFEPYGGIDVSIYPELDGKGGAWALVLHRDKPTRDIRVIKQWATHGSDITWEEVIIKTVEIVLYANGVRLQGPITLYRANMNCCIERGALSCHIYEWQHIFSGLPVYDDQGIAINYEVREINVPDYFIPYYWNQGSDLIVIQNLYYRINFEFRKVNISNRPLQGAEFALYARVYVPGTGYDYVLVQTAISDNDGMVNFDRLRRNAVYRLVETQAPAGYQTPDGYWLLTIGIRGNVTITEHGGAPVFGGLVKNVRQLANVPQQTTPAETTPQQTTPAETTSQQTTPAETTPAETTPQQTTPVETTPQQTTPAETTPQQTTPAETTPQQTTPAETTPQQTTPAETTPQQTTPAETTPQQTTPAETTPQQTTPAETTPQQTTPQQTTPAETTPQQTTPAETTPQQTTPAETTPQQTTPAETTPQQTTPAETTPQQTTPQQTTPQQTTPQQTTPQQTTPQQTTPQQTTPQQTTPQQTTPQQTTPQQTTPQQTTPQQTTPQQTTPQQTTPPQTTPPPTTPHTDPPTRVITFPPTTPAATTSATATTTPTATTPIATTPTPTTTPTTTQPPMIKIPSAMVTNVGGTIDWTLSGFHNRTGGAVNDFTIIDMPGRGLNFSSGSMPAFANGAGVTYDIRYRVAGSSQWRTLVTGVNAAAPFTFSLPQPGNIHYTEIRFDFGTVPANFGLGNTIILTFVVGSGAPNNTLVNDFMVSHNRGTTHGQSPHTPTVVPPRPPTNGTLVPDGNGYIELDDNNVPQGNWEWREGNGWAFTPFPNTPVPLGPLPQTGNESLIYWISAIVSLMASGGLIALIMAKKKKKFK